MPLTSHGSDASAGALAGHLYVVATPIGNLADITLRALEILKTVDLIAAEDTRQAARILKYYQIGKPLISYFEHNEDERAPGLVRRLKEGTAIALISNAGTPTVSDPGYRLVTSAIEAGVSVAPIPGVAAPVAALSASGLATDAFVFVGFLDRKKQKRMKQIQEMKTDRRTQIMYESPRRLHGLLEALEGILGNRRAVLAREMTKPHEEFIRGTLSHIREVLSGRGEVRGECTLLIAGDGGDLAVTAESLRQEISAAMGQSNEKPGILARRIADRLGLPRKTVYEEILKWKN